MARRGKYTEAEIVAYTILGEAAGEGPAGMAAVAQVIKNRANSGGYPSSPSKVALQKRNGTYQFTTWSPKFGNNPTGTYRRSSPEFEQALKIAKAVLYGDLPDPTGGALNYYANSGTNAISAPGWFNNAATGGAVQIGNHVFAARVAGADASTYGTVIDAIVNGAPVPLAKPQSVINQQSGLTRGGLMLPGPLIPDMAYPAPQGPVYSRGAVGAALRRMAGQKETLGGLVTRKVNTVPVDKNAGQLSLGQRALRDVDPKVLDGAIDYMSLTSGARRAQSLGSSSATEKLQQINDAEETRRMNVQKSSPVLVTPKSATETLQSINDRRETQQQQAQRSNTGIDRNVQTVVKRSNGTTTVVQQAGSVAMPAGVRPTNTAVVGNVPGKSANANLQEARTEQKTITKMIAKTIMVKNPEWGKVNPVAVEKLQDIHDKRDDAIMLAQQGTPVPEFIEKTIMVPVTQTITVPKKAPVEITVRGGNPTAPQSRYAVGQRYTSAGYIYETQQDGTFKRVGQAPGYEGLSPSATYDKVNADARARAVKNAGSAPKTSSQKNNDGSWATGETSGSPFW